MRRATLALLLIVINLSGCAKHLPPTPPVADPTIVMMPSATPSEEPSVDTGALAGMWHGYMVVDVQNHRVAFLPWNGDGVFDPGGAVEVKGTPGDDPNNYLFVSPFRSLFTGAVIHDGKVLALMPVGTTCMIVVPAYPYSGMPGFSLNAAGVSGALYKTVLEEGRPAAMIGDCSAITEQ